MPTTEAPALVRDLDPRVTPQGQLQMRGTEKAPGAASSLPEALAWPIAAAVVLVLCTLCGCAALTMCLCTRGGSKSTHKSREELEPLNEAEQGLLTQAAEVPHQHEGHIGGLVPPLLPMTLPPSLSLTMPPVASFAAIPTAHVVAATPMAVRAVATTAVARPVEAVPMAVAGVDTSHDGRANYFYVGADRNHDGIPDALQRGVGRELRTR